MRSVIARVLTREFVVNWCIAFASGVGALSGVIALLPRVDLNAARSAVILVACAIVALFYALIKTRRVHLHVSDLVPPGLSPRPFMMVAIQCNQSLLTQVNDLAGEIYGPDVLPIPRKQYEEWLAVNCNILACLVDQNQRAVGYFDVLPLRDDFADRFIRGEVGERDIRGEHIHPPQTARQCKYVYLAGFAVAEPGTFRHATCLLWALKRYLEHFYQPFDTKQLLAAGATPEGETILQRYNFQLLQPGRIRKDGSPIYAATLSERLLKSVTVAPDWSVACRLSWEDEAAEAQPDRHSSIA